MDIFEIANEIKNQISIKPKVGIVLGSGLSDVYKMIEKPEVIDYAEIPGFPVSTVAGHQGRYIFGYIENVPVVCMQGRVHYYEGYEIDEVVMPIRIMGLLGIETLVLTNAAGGISEFIDEGNVVIIKDHISSFVPSPLRGANEERLGTRFPDMTTVYDKELREKLKEACIINNLEVKEGVYLQSPGPQYETPAEIKMMAAIGADVVGMSTAVEAIAARHMGIRVAGLSSVSNKAAGLGSELSHEDVVKVSGMMGEKVAGILRSFLKQL